MKTWAFLAHWVVLSVFLATPSIPIINVWSMPVLANNPAFCTQGQNEEHKRRLRRYLHNLKDHSVDDPKYLESPRAESAIQLGHLKDTLAVKPLTEILMHDDYPDVRAAAAYALGEIGDKRAIPSLRVALQDCCIEVRLWAAWSLINLDKGESENLLSVLIPIAKGVDQLNWDLRGMRRKNTVDKSVTNPKWDQDRRDAWRCHAIRLLGKINTAKAWQVIKSLSNDHSKRVAVTVESLLKKHKHTTP